MPNDVNPRRLEYEEMDMQYFDFLIRKEHVFLRNFQSHEELNKSLSIKNLEPYYAIFQNFLKIIIFMENDINNSET